MGRLLSIDYGKKRTGIAVTDVLKLSINGLPTLPTKELWDFLNDYLTIEEVESVIIGWPTQKNGEVSHLGVDIVALENRIKKNFPKLEIFRVDENLSSAEAKSKILEYGVPKKKRKDKTLTDKVSAMIILQRHLTTI